MSVYEFEKSLLVRLEESTNVLQCRDEAVPASEVRSEWAYHVELQIEPAGWQAVWKISRAFCEELNIKYPTVVCGVVTNVFFRDIKAEFTVSAVQDDDVHIPQYHVVPLEDLWPTIDQENPELNTERTAECIDQLRFFFRNVWMPWDEDNDEDIDWSEKHLESRIRFCFDLKRGMSRPMADHVRVLLTEARYIQSRREIIENVLNDSDEEDMDNSSKLDKSHVTDLMRLHLRLAVIRNEIELLENPEMRQMYEEIHFPTRKTDTGNVTKRSNIFMVSLEGTISDQIEYMNAAKTHVSDDKSVKIVTTLQDCFKISTPSDQIYIPNGCHEIKSLEFLNSNGSIKAILAAGTPRKGDETIPTAEPNPSAEAIILSGEENSTLLVFNGDYSLENITFDCRNVRTGLWIRSGCVTLKNCVLLGEQRSSTGNGIIVSNGAAVNLENCVLKSFASGISCAAAAKATLSNCTILNCRCGLEVGDKSVLEIKETKIAQTRGYGVVFKATELATLKNDGKVVCSSFEDLKGILSANNKLCPFAGECDFKANQKGNIFVYREDVGNALQCSEFIEDSIDKENVSPANRSAKSENDKNSGNVLTAVNNNTSSVSVHSGTTSKTASSNSEDSFVSTGDANMNDSVIIVD